RQAQPRIRARTIPATTRRIRSRVFAYSGGRTLAACWFRHSAETILCAPQNLASAYCTHTSTVPDPAPPLRAWLTDRHLPRRAALQKQSNPNRTSAPRRLLVD